MGYFLKSGANSNSGNTARRCFQSADIFANICKVPVLLVEKLWHVYLAITSKLPINSEGLQTLCDETKAIFFEHYKKPCVSQEGSDTWYNCPPSVHRVLDHAKIINDSLPGPPGLFSEEGSESNNKEFRRFRRLRVNPPITPITPTFPNQQNHQN